MDDDLDRADSDELDLTGLDGKAVGDGTVQRDVRQGVDKGLLGFNRSGFGLWP
jgi:hypothetical protein